MRVALFTETFLPKIDGIVTTLCETIRQLHKLGHEALIFAPDGGLDEFEGARIVRMKSRAFPLYPELRLSLPHASMRATLCEFQPDLLHVADPALLGIAGLYYGGGDHGGALHLPLVVSYHTDLPAYLHYYKLRFMEPVTWPILRARHNRATINLGTSVAIVEQLRRHGVKRVALWPGGVDTERFRPGRGSPEMRAHLTGGHPESPLLTYVGRLSAEKSIERLKPILEAFPGARLALLGDGPHHKALREHFAGMPVTMAGFLRGDELATAFASSDIFVMPSRTETLGLVILEAMSSGVPVVAARAGGIPELIEDGVTGYLFDEETEAIAAIQNLLRSQETRSAIGIAGRQWASEHSWAAATQELIKCYQAACEGQNVSDDPAQEHPSLRFRARRAARRTTLFAIRKLLP